jgi:hypothetical protein
VPKVDRNYCRSAAKECVQQALVVVDLHKKKFLFARAQEWLQLAYAEGDKEFDSLLQDFNRRQLAIEPQASQSPISSGLTRRHLVQRQRRSDDDEEEEDEK